MAVIGVWLAVLLIIALFYWGHAYYDTIGRTAAPDCVVRYESVCKVHTMDGDITVVVKNNPATGSHNARYYDIVTPRTGT